jgi:hypothetical protein
MHRSRRQTLVFDRGGVARPTAALPKPALESDVDLGTTVEFDNEEPTTERPARSNRAVTGR